MDVQPRTPVALSPADRAWLDQLVVHMGPRLLAYVHRAFGWNHEAEDIVAETFLRAARNVGAMRASQRPDLYLLTTARNLCRDQFRRRRVRSVSDERLEAASVEDVDEEYVADDEERERMRAAIAELPDELREVVVLRLSTELTFEQIAEVLHVPLGTALSRMHAAVRRLRKMMGCVHER